MTWTSSRVAWPLWSSASPASSGDSTNDPAAAPQDPTASLLEARRAALRQSLRDVEPERFAAALDRAIAARGRALVEAVERYRRHPYERALDDPPALWSDGPARLLDYGALPEAPGAAAGIPVLVVPSLINRAYVLDLSAHRSLLRWLAGAGFRPLLLDWGAPDEATRRFTLTDYVAGTLEGALDAALAATGRAPLLLGYCMGGLLALALAQRRQRDLAALALLATPWDFAAGDGLQGALARAALVGFAPLLELTGELSVDAVQSLFAGLDPELGVRKFLAFGQLDPDSRRAEDFVALEDWLNDGIPLAAPVARECLGGWYAANTPARGLWRIAGQPVEPDGLDLPSLVLVPSRDRIVPPASALALGAAIPGAEIRRPASGHIGMVVSGRAPETVWRPLADWLRTHG